MTKQDRRFRREQEAAEQAEVIVTNAIRAVTCRAVLDDSTPGGVDSTHRPHRGGRPTERHDMTVKTATPTEAPAKAYTQPLTSREVAEAIGTDPKTLRRFLRDPRSTYAAAGQGGRYSFVKKDIAGLKKRFNAWKNDEAKARAAREAARAEKAAKAEKVPAPRKASGKATKPAAPTFTAEDRVDRLEAMLRANGTHISQHR